MFTDDVSSEISSSSSNAGHADGALRNVSPVSSMTDNPLVASGGTDFVDENHSSGCINRPPDVDVDLDLPNLGEGPPSRRTRSRTAGRAELGLLGALDVKDSSHILCALAAVDSREVEQPIPHVPLNEIGPEPMSYEAAMTSKYKEVWQKAMATELEGLRATNTFATAEKPPDRKAIGAKWVFKWEWTDHAGLVVKAKARLVAKGYSQVEGVDYLETFAPTPASASIRMLTAFACEHDLDMHHLDAEQAFIQSELDEEIFMRLPPGCGDVSGNAVLLDRSFYGLKQVGRAWNVLLK